MGAPHIEANYSNDGIKTLHDTEERNGQTFPTSSGDCAGNLRARGVQ
jgi:hypothetical protein